MRVVARRQFRIRLGQALPQAQYYQLNLVEKIIKNPNSGDLQGTARVYRGFAQRFRCDISGRCTEVERIPLKAVVEFRNDPNMLGQKGVITAHCTHGPLECPSWVNNVRNVAPA